MSIENLKIALPEYAKDLKLNLSTLAAEPALTEQQRAGTFIAAALASRSAAVIRALVSEFGPDRCVWGSDWPFLRMPERVDYGPLLNLLAEQVPDDDERRRILWDTPAREFGFQV